MNEEDPVAEVRKIRHEIGARFNHDFKKISAHIKEMQENSTLKFAKLPHVSLNIKSAH